LAQFTENGCIHVDHRELASIQLADRVQFPVVISSGTHSEPTVQFTTPERSGGYWSSPKSFPDLVEVPTGTVHGQVSVFIDDSDKWKESLRIVLDDYALLLVSVDDVSGASNSALGTIRLVAPIHQTDVSISSEKRNILKVLVRSTESLPLMERIGATSENVIGSPEGALRAGVSSPVSAGVRNGINLLQARQQNVLWRLSIWFENEADCEAASQHIELRRIQVRHEKLNKLKIILESWSDISCFNPESKIFV